MNKYDYIHFQVGTGAMRTSVVGSLACGWEADKKTLVPFVDVQTNIPEQRGELPYCPDCITFTKRILRRRSDLIAQLEELEGPEPTTCRYCDNSLAGDPSVGIFPHSEFDCRTILDDASAMLVDSDAPAEAIMHAVKRAIAVSKGDQLPDLAVMAGNLMVEVGSFPDDEIVKSVERVIAKRGIPTGMEKAALVLRNERIGGYLV